MSDDKENGEEPRVHLSRRLAAGALAASIGISGAGAGGAYYGARGLPDRVEAVEVEVKTLSARVATLENDRAEMRGNSRAVLDRLTAVESELHRRADWMQDTTRRLGGISASLRILLGRAEGGQGD